MKVKIVCRSMNFHEVKTTITSNHVKKQKQKQDIHRTPEVLFICNIYNPLPLQGETLLWFQHPRLFLPILIFYVHGIILYVFLCLTSFFQHCLFGFVFLQVIVVFHSYCYSQLCKYAIIIYSFVNGDLGYFIQCFYEHSSTHLLVNTYMHTFRYCQTFFHSSIPIYTPTSSIWEFWFWHPVNIFFLFWFILFCFLLVTLVGVYWHHIVV